MRRPGKGWCLPLVASLGAFALGPLLAQIGAVEPLTGLKVFAASGLLGAISLIWGVRLLRGGARAKGAASALAGLLPLAVLAASLASSRSFPLVNDVSTDLDNPPRFTAAQSAADNAGKDLAYPEDFKEAVRLGYPDLLSKTLGLAPADAYRKVRDAAAAMPGWKVVRTDDAAMTIEGTQTSGIFRFVDDFVIRVEPIGEKALVAMRSRSRVGKGDFGANAARIRAFFAALEP